jgi:uncharacterized phage protein gp47/JayE
MPVLTQTQIAEQMVAQIRLLKPTISAEVGTPERLVFDTVSGAIAENSIDLVGLQEALNVDSKFGSNLTNFMSLFGFERQKATLATGFVKFKRNTPATVNIVIPSGVILKSHISTATDGILPEFVTTSTITLHVGESETGLVPIKAKTPGSIGDVPAEAITIMSFAPVLGITSVTNPAATTGGNDQEDDNSLKTRFKNTVFRNLAGTEDQFLALCVATAFSTKANVIGPISKYQEYIQVPAGTDQTSYPFGGGESYGGYPYPLMVRGSGVNGSNVVTIPSTIGIKVGDPVEVFKSEDSPILAVSGTIAEIKSPTEIVVSKALASTVEGGWVFVGEWKPYYETLVTKWTTALSTNPFAKEIWKGLPVFISDTTSGISKFFFREGVDFNFNYPPLLQGDTLRAMIDGVGVDPRTNITGKNQPNVTFTNVYLGSEEAIQALSPNDVILFEYAYTSLASRNSILHNVTNAVDVYIDGTNEQSTSTIFTAPLAGNSQAFVDNPTSMYYYENYRRDGEPTKRPLEGNILTTLFALPVLGIPAQITIGENKYYRGHHYWLVHDVSGYGGTIRARDGIEWSATIPADLGKPEEGIPNPGKEEPEYTGKRFSELESPETVEVEPYFYDQNIEDLQAALEASRQVTTDLLAHKARVRYFKLDITVVYAPQATPSTVNNAIHEAIETFFADQFFGSVIRLSDLLQQIHNVAGVQNVRWSNDVPNDPNLIRVWQTDINGKPLEGVTLDRIRWGNKTEKEIQALYIVGHPERGAYQLVYGPAGAEKTEEIKPIEEGTTAAILEAQINKVISPETVKVSEDIRVSTNVTESIRSFRIEYQKVGKQSGAPLKALPTVFYPLAPADKPFAGGEYTFDSDFFLRDDELPALPTGTQEGDTVPGLIIKSRAQNVWEKA